jgi:outer membrane receptor protein involved in Fe transport
LFGIYNHPCGFFGEVQSLWFQQSNHDSRFETDGDDFWQFNVFAGYRLFQRRAEITLGVLNLTDRNYRLGPMNLTPNLARERTFAARFRINL